MRTYTFPAPGRTFGWALVTLALAATLPASAFGADRVVLGEHFAKLG